MSRIGLSLDKVIVTQAGLRHEEQLAEMVGFIEEGGKFNASALGSYAIRHGLKISPLIEIAKFEDGCYALHNGHHRAAAIFIGREYPCFYKDEYFIREWKYEDYLEVVLPNWVTPFDVRTELRLAELKYWKQQVRELYINQGEASTIDFIKENRLEYTTLRNDLYLIEDFVKEYNLYDRVA